MAERERDADTGEEMIFFHRKGKPYLYLRDAVTKRFIKRLKVFEKRYYAVVDYGKEKAKKHNPLYIDAGILTIINAENFPNRDKIDKQLQDTLDKIIAEMFGEEVTKKLLESAGEEYGSKPTYTAEYEKGEAHYIVVWKHHKEAPPRTKEGDVKI